MKCEAHKGRGRAPKDCLDCEAGRPGSVVGESFDTYVKRQAEMQSDAAAVAPVTRKRKTYRIEYEDAPKTPRTTEDGRTWLDPDGNPPVEDTDGRLLQPFRYQLVHGGVELWPAGLRLPEPPTKFAEWAASLEAARAKIHKPKGG